MSFLPSLTVPLALLERLFLVHDGAQNSLPNLRAGSTGMRARAFAESARMLNPSDETGYGSLTQTYEDGPLESHAPAT